MTQYVAGVRYGHAGMASVARNGCLANVADVDAHTIVGPGVVYRFVGGFVLTTLGGIQSFQAQQSYALSATLLAQLIAAGAPAVPVDVQTSAGSTAAPITLPGAGGSLVRVSNTGASSVYVATSGTATAGSPSVPAGGSALFDLPTAQTATISVLSSAGTVPITVARGLGQSHTN